MSIQVHPAALKVVAKLSGQVKDITSNVKKYTWSSLHRLVVKDSWLVLFTNDGQVFLEWGIPLDNTSQENYEAVIPAVQFNDIASKSLGVSPYQINYHDGLLELAQGQTKLKIRTEPAHAYPDPVVIKPDDPTWLITASTLNKDLGFVTPFIDENNATLKVATWTTSGDLIGGTLQLMVRVKGLPVPLVPMNFTQRAAKALGAFLAALEGDVQITVTERHYVFECPIYRHRLAIARELNSFRMPQNREGGETEVLKVDGPRLLSSVSILEAMLPKDGNKLLFGVNGNKEEALIKMSTAMEDAKSSQDEVPIIRETLPVNGDTLPVTQFSVNNKFLGLALREMTGVILTLKYYHDDKLLYIEDERCNDTDTHRIAMLVVNSTASLKGKELEESKK
jgi:hypothetical protein